MTNMTTVVNIKLDCLRHKIYVKDWLANSNNVYIGSGVAVDNETYPEGENMWANPYKAGKDFDLSHVMSRYKLYMFGLIQSGDVKLSDFNRIKGKKLGCWCHPKLCHGDILQSIINNTCNTLPILSITPVNFLTNGSVEQYSRDAAVRMSKSEHGRCGTGLKKSKSLPRIVNTRQIGITRSSSAFTSRDTYTATSKSRRPSSVPIPATSVKLLMLPHLADLPRYSPRQMTIKSPTPSCRVKTLKLPLTTSNLVLSRTAIPE